MVKKLFNSKAETIVQFQIRISYLIKAIKKGLKLLKKDQLCLIQKKNWSKTKNLWENVSTFANKIFAQVKYVDRQIIDTNKKVKL